MENLILNLYEIDDGEKWVYCAESEDEALRMYLETFVSIPENLDDVNDDDLPVPLDKIKIFRLDDNKILSVKDAESFNEETTIKKTVFEWSLEGKGLVCSTV